MKAILLILFLASVSIYAKDIDPDILKINSLISERMFGDDFSIEIKNLYVDCGLTLREIRVYRYTYGMFIIYSAKYNVGGLIKSPPEIKSARVNRHFCYNTSSPDEKHRYKLKTKTYDFLHSNLSDNELDIKFGRMLKRRLRALFYSFFLNKKKIKLQKDGSNVILKYNHKVVGTLPFPHRLQLKKGKKDDKTPRTNGKKWN